MVDLAEKSLSYQKNGNPENGATGRIRREKCHQSAHSESGRDVEIKEITIERSRRNAKGMHTQ